MKTSHAAVFHGPNLPLTLETIAIPDLDEGEILVRNEYTTLCRSDLNTYSGKRSEKTPTILGHEIVGTIEAFGPGAPATDGRGAKLHVGDRVTWAIFASNPDSDLSRRGIPQKAPGVFKYGHQQIAANSNLHGGLAEHCILRRNTPILRVDKLLPLPLLALINCSVATVAGAMRLAGSVAGRVVVIAGTGMLGIIACAMCRCAGAAQIIAMDVNDDRLTSARRFGADFAVNPRSAGPAAGERLTALIPGEPVSVALDFSGDPEMMEGLISLLGIGGTAVFIGATFPQRALQINAEQLIRKIHTIKGLHNYNEQDFATAADFVERNHLRFPFASLVRVEFELDAVNEAFECALKSGAYRVGVRIGKSGRDHEV